MGKPDFVCIGPHKTGTTWLYNVLRTHPQVWLPPKKELWVLNQMGIPYGERLRSYINRTGMPGDIWKSFEADIRTRLMQNPFRRQNLSAVSWWLKFLFIPYSFRTYSSLFPNNLYGISGDITPNYYFLSTEIIKQLSQYLPDLKVLIILRDPVERAWSYVRMIVRDSGQAQLDTLSDEEWIKQLEAVHSWWKPYLNTILEWKQYFGQVYITYYDLLQANTYEFYERICFFLDIDSTCISPHIGQINKGIPNALNLKLRDYLSQKYYQEIYELAEWSNSLYPKKWLHSMKHS